MVNRMRTATSVHHGGVVVGEGHGSLQREPEHTPSGKLCRLCREVVDQEEED